MHNTLRLNVPFLVFWVGQKCTLLCKNCGNLIPCGHQRIYEPLKSLKALMLLTRYINIDKIQIQGGEPLVHPQLDIFLESIAQLPISNISISTNGTSRFSQQALDVLKKYKKIEVTISNYECSKKIREKLIKQLEDNNIKYQVYQFLYGSNEWFNSGGLEIERNNNDNEVQALYNSCENKGCLTLADGKIFTCGKIPTFIDIKKLNPELNHVVDIIEKFSTAPHLLQSCLLDFFAKQNLFKETCRFCLGTKSKIPPAIQFTNEELQKYSNFRKGIFIH